MKDLEKSAIKLKIKKNAKNIQRMNEAIRTNEPNSSLIYRLKHKIIDDFIVK